MKPTVVKRRPASISASRTSSQLGTVMPSGFSVRTGLPAAMQASTYVDVCLGVGGDDDGVDLGIVDEGLVIGRRRAHRTRWPRASARSRSRSWTATRRALSPSERDAAGVIRALLAGADDADADHVVILLLGLDGCRVGGVSWPSCHARRPTVMSPGGLVRTRARPNPRVGVEHEADHALEGTGEPDLGHRRARRASALHYTRPPRTIAPWTSRTNGSAGHARA